MIEVCFYRHGDSANPFCKYTKVDGVRRKLNDDEMAIINLAIQQGSYCSETWDNGGCLTVYLPDNAI